MADLPKIGIDIGTSSVKVVELAPAGTSRWRLLAAASVPTPPGGGMGGPAHEAIIVQSLSTLMKQWGIISK